MKYLYLSMNYGFPIRPKRKTGKTEKHCGTSVSSRHPQKKNPKNPRATARCFSGFSICAFINCRPESTQPSGFSVFRVFRQGYRRGCGATPGHRLGVGGFKSPSLVGPRPAGEASAHGEVSQRGGGVKRVSPGCMIASENPFFAAAGHGQPTRINVDTLVAMNLPHGRKAVCQGLPEQGADHHED